MPSDSRPSTVDFDALTQRLNAPDFKGMNFARTAGLLFAAICAPGGLPLPRWFAEVTGNHGFKTEGEARALLRELTALRDWIEARLSAGSLPLPPGIELLESPMDNFAPEAPMADWARGFRTGHAMSEEAWQKSEDSADLGLALMSLSFFGSRRFAEDASQELVDGGMPVERMAETVCRLLPNAFEVYAAAGRATPVETDLEAPGRNAPCPCGSGKKFKRCCGERARRSVH
ncbi:UPF0149 family protein [Wenzhouxiangella marina]|uniref:Uncharacterized protein n=1 Tax=Wenzhouxiangella marina TaxID=1579979 RepID=A0A0K0XY21_9GAMM|nr:UPF0149 family protein [Wenzhouxiangella marina]AKS42532.1 hypothetical protein WM2015_2169 [Wenzhouxiangella marina]MBB6085691.1 uncharacterized protein [Wenzhouxiangella marina]